MTRGPDVHDAWNGEVALVDEVFGAGLVDLLHLQGYVSHLDLDRESQHLARSLVPDRWHLYRVAGG